MINQGCVSSLPCALLSLLCINRLKIGFCSIKLVKFTSTLSQVFAINLDHSLFLIQNHDILCIKVCPSELPVQISFFFLNIYLHILYVHLFVTPPPIFTNFHFLLFFLNSWYILYFLQKCFVLFTSIYALNVKRVTQSVNKAMFKIKIFIQWCNIHCKTPWYTAKLIIQM